MNNNATDNFFLLCDVGGNRVWLASGDAKTRFDRPLVTLDVGRAARGFNLVAGPMPMQGYSIFQAAQMAGVSVHVLRRWIALGIVVPKRPGRVGRDGSARFDKVEAFAIAAVGALNRSKVPQGIMRRAYRLLTNDVTSNTAGHGQQGDALAPSLN